MEHVKQTLAKLNMASLQLNKQGSKVKEEPSIQELTLTFDLMRSFMYKNEDVKVIKERGMEVIVYYMYRCITFRTKVVIFIVLTYIWISMLYYKLYMKPSFSLNVKTKKTW